MPVDNARIYRTIRQLQNLKLEAMNEQMVSPIPAADYKTLITQFDRLIVYYKIILKNPNDYDPP